MHINDIYLNYLRIFFMNDKECKAWLHKWGSLATASGIYFFIGRECQFRLPNYQFNSDGPTLPECNLNKAHLWCIIVWVYCILSLRNVKQPRLGGHFGWSLLPSPLILSLLPNPRYGSKTGEWRTRGSGTLSAGHTPWTPTCVPLWWARLQQAYLTPFSPTSPCTSTLTSGWGQVPPPFPAPSLHPSGHWIPCASHTPPTPGRVVYPQQLSTPIPMWCTILPLAPAPSASTGDQTNCSKPEGWPRLAWINHTVPKRWLPVWTGGKRCLCPDEVSCSSYQEIMIWSQWWWQYIEPNHTSWSDKLPSLEECNLIQLSMLLVL